MDDLAKGLLSMYNNSVSAADDIPKLSLLLKKLSSLFYFIAILFNLTICFFIVPPKDKPAKTEKLKKKVIPPKGNFHLPILGFLH